MERYNVRLSFLPRNHFEKLLVVTHHVKTIYQLKKIKNLNILLENKQILCYFKLKSLWIQGVISFKKGFDVYPSKGLANEIARNI